MLLLLEEEEARSASTMLLQEECFDVVDVLCLPSLMIHPKVCNRSSVVRWDTLDSYAIVSIIANDNIINTLEQGEMRHDSDNCDRIDLSVVIHTREKFNTHAHAHTHLS